MNLLVMLFGPGALWYGALAARSDFSTPAAWRRRPGP
jgi:hypothetical protein